VLIQTYAPHHYSIRAARDQDYARFFVANSKLRRELMYPPFARMALVRIEGPEAARVSEIAERVAAMLGRVAKPDTSAYWGRRPRRIERIKRRYRWQVVVKSTSLTVMRAALAAYARRGHADCERAGVRVALDIDPVNML